MVPSAAKTHLDRALHCTWRLAYVYHGMPSPRQFDIRYSSSRVLKLGDPLLGPWAEVLLVRSQRRVRNRNQYSGGAQRHLVGVSTHTWSDLSRTVCWDNRMTHVWHRAYALPGEKPVVEQELMRRTRLLLSTETYWDDAPLRLG